MKKRKLIGCLFVFILFFIRSSGWTLAEERNIFIGDLIQIKVTTQQFSENELREKFHDFEIVNMEEEGDGYLITLRSFEVGKKKVELGNKEIVIDIKSTLDEIQRDGIFEGDLTLEEPGISIPWKYVLIILSVGFSTSGGMVLWGYIKKKKKSSISPYQQFMNQTTSISIEKPDYLVKLTFCLKEYLETRYSCQIKGKTSAEILDAMKSFPNIESSIPGVRGWLEECDAIKYRGISASIEKKQNLYECLIELVRKIDETKEG